MCMSVINGMGVPKKLQFAAYGQFVLVFYQSELARPENSKVPSLPTSTIFGSIQN